MRSIRRASVFAVVVVAWVVAVTPGSAFAGNTLTVALALLMVQAGPIWLSNGVETPVVQNDVYAPCHPNFNPTWSIRSVEGCPLPYTWWQVQLMVAPMTVQNTGKIAGTLTVNIYSDNGYVYQQQVTIAADALMPIYFGAQNLGAISSEDGAAPMPIAVTMTATGPLMKVLLDTQAAADYRGGFTYSRVAGFTVQLLPMD